MRDITHQVLARKRSPKNYSSFIRTKAAALSMVVTLGVVGIAFAAIALAASSVDWSNNGTHLVDGQRVLDTSQCDENNTPYLLWVFTGNGATSANITIKDNGTTVVNGAAMTQQGGGAYHYTSNYYNLNTISASVTYNGTVTGNANLVISHGCAGGSSVTTTTLKDASNNTVTEGASVPLGSVIHDTATVTLTPSAVPTGSVSFRFYGTVAACTADTNFSGGTTKGTVALNGANPGVADPSQATTALAPGTYAFKANWPGMTGYTGSTSTCETFTVTKAQLTTATNIHNPTHGVVTSVALGTVVHDTATLSGAVAGFPTSAITFKFYPNLTCTGDGSTVANTGADQGDGALVRSADSAALAAGSYAYKASVAGDTNYIGDDSDCEPLTVNKAQLSIVTNVHNATHVDKTSSNVPLGSVMHDTATVSGGVGGFTLPTDISFTLTTGYTGSCADGASVANNGTEGAAAKSADSLALGAGSYAYRATVGGNDNYIGATGVCEPFTVNKAQLAIRTDIHNSSHQVVTTVSTGAIVHDTATVTGGVGAFTLPAVTFTFYNNNTCTGTGTSVANTGADGSAVRSANSAALVPGFYSYSATVAGNDNYIGATATCESLSVAAYWCSPGFWATAISQNRTGVLTYLTNHGVNLSTKYSVAMAAVNGADLSKKAPAGDPTISQVLLSPQTYGGPAFNTVADYISKVLGWGGTQNTGENCPLNAQGTFTGVTLSLNI